MLDSTNASDFDAVREHTTKLIQDAAKEDQPVLIEAPPGSGKTTTATELALETNHPITYLAGRVDLYEQAEKWCKDHEDISYERIPAPHRDCSSFPDENNGSTSAIERLYNKGYSGREIHRRFPEQAPCGKSCEYYQKLDRIDNEIESIDFLIGHHAHCNRHQYIRERIVIIDEFNPDPFLRSFPDDNSGVVDAPGDIISGFLSALNNADTDFPTDVYRDVTDLIQQREGDTGWQEAIDWFHDHGANRRAGQNSDFLDPTLKKHDNVHAYAPFLAFSLLCMERVGPGIDLAPPPGGALDETWQDADLGPATKCVRDRNTGEMYGLNPPNLSAAEQVIGLDGTPTMELWNLLFAPAGFDHWQVISREDFPKYLRSAMNMSLIQIGDGRHPYAAGNVSDLDLNRFRAVQALEGEPFALISTKKALKRYQAKGLLDLFVSRTDSCQENGSETRVSANHQALHYATVKSSNDFEKESLGFVAGMPHPGDDVVRLWTGFCGEAVEITRSDEGDVEKPFGGLGDKIYQHFAHNQVVQATLRFGRNESVYENDGATVYISTHALPDWFEVDTEYDVQSKELEGAVLAKLYEIYQGEDFSDLALRTVRQIHESVDKDNRLKKDASKRGVRNALENISSKDYVRVEPDRGEYSADLYGWNGGGEVLQTKDDTTLLQVQDDIHILQLRNEWEP